MAGLKSEVAAPTFSPRNFGLLSVVQPRYDEPDSHWRNGVKWQEVCGMAGTTFDQFCQPEPAPQPADKAANQTITTFGAKPFAVFGELDCSPVGYTQEQRRAMAVDALTRVEQFQVENTFWTGNAGGSAGYVNPHLASLVAVVDTDGIVPIKLNCAVTAVSGSVSGTGATVFEVTEAVGRIEAAMGACYGGQVTLHVPTILAERMVSSAIVKANGAQMQTGKGNLVAFGDGYPGTAPDGTATPNAAWIYATGPVFAYRSQPETFQFTEEFDRSKNTLKTIVERSYVLGYSCCCTYAIAVQLTGGVPL
jgi:hypothetical protein